MDARTRRQLHALSLAFYEERAADFDASRVDLPWPGWDRVARHLPAGRLRVLDIGCGNGRYALDLLDRGRALHYVGTDASEALLAAARERVGAALEAEAADPGAQADAAEARPSAARFLQQDFLASEPVGADLPAGPFELVALMGVMHHVPGAAARAQLIRAAAERVAPGGILALTAWQFAERPRFEKRRVPWRAVGPVLGAPIDETRLEPGDTLLRFGSSPDAAPRYCHQVSEEEFAAWSSHAALAGVEPADDFRADGAEGDLNRYGVGRRPR